MFDKFFTGADEVRLLCFILFPVLNCVAEHCDNACYYYFICFIRLWFWRVWCWMQAEMWSLCESEWLWQVHWRMSTWMWSWIQPSLLPRK